MVEITENHNKKHTLLVCLIWISPLFLKLYATHDTFYKLHLLKLSEVILTYLKVSKNT